MVFLSGFGCVGGVYVHSNSRRELRTGMSATLTHLQSTVLQSPGTRTARHSPAHIPTSAQHISTLFCRNRLYRKRDSLVFMPI